MKKNSINFKMDYLNLEIDGMHYLRTLKEKRGDIDCFLVINNKNKPVKNVYKFLKYRKDQGDSLNTLKRIAHDLCYFLDFMMFNNICEKSIDKIKFVEFIKEYLIIVDSNFRVKDCIEKSMLKKIPILEEYKNENVKVLYKSFTKGLDIQSIIRIAENSKNYLVFLKEECMENIDIDSMFQKIIYKKIYNDGLLCNSD